MRFCNFRQARRELERAIDTNERYPAAHSALGTVLYFEGQLDDAYEEFKRAAELGQDAASYCDLGVIQRNLGRQAIRSFKKATEVNPGFAQAWEQLGHMRFEAEDYKGAVEAFRTWARLSEDSALAKYYLGRALYYSENHDESVETLKEAIGQDGKLKWAYPLLGMALSKGGRDHEAESVLEDCKARWRRNADCHEALGIHFLKKGDLDKAIIELQHSVKIDGSDFETWHYLAVALQRKYMPVHPELRTASSREVG